MRSFILYTEVNVGIFQRILLRERKKENGSILLLRLVIHLDVVRKIKQKPINFMKSQKNSCTTQLRM
jgi:hypothetical protein